MGRKPDKRGNYRGAKPDFFDSASRDTLWYLGQR